MKSIMNVPTLKSQLLLMPIEPILKHKLGPLEVSDVAVKITTTSSPNYILEKKNLVLAGSKLVLVLLD
jgi:hypothetical protein